MYKNVLFKFLEFSNTRFLIFYFQFIKFDIGNIDVLIIDKFLKLYIVLLCIQHYAVK